jgi:LysM repeat protein
MRKFTIIVLALGIALAVFAVAPTQQASADVSAQYYPGTTHWVQWGETLYSIGRLYNVSPQCIAHANGLFNPNLIYAGQALYIPYGCAPYPAPPPYPPVPPPPPPPPPPYCYVVHYGDTLWSISTSHGMNPWCVSQANGLANPNYIYAGQCLTLPQYCAYGW